MTSGIGTIHLKVVHGTLVIQGDGRTPRGKRYIKETIPLEAKNPSDPNFKQELANAVDRMLAEQPVLPL